MTPVDGIVLGLIAFAAIYGAIRGIVSQLVGIAGLILALLFSSTLGAWVSPWLRSAFDLSKFMADKSAVFSCGLGIYVACRLVGMTFEKTLISKSRELRSMNRVGGALLGGLKGTLIVGLALCFLSIVPKDWLGSWFPKLPKSQSYRLASRFNPMGNADSIERMRKLRTTFSDPKKLEKAKKSKEVRAVLEKHKMPAMLEDRRLQKVLEDGDYDTLHQNPDFDQLVAEDQLVDLLDRIEKEKP